MRTLLNLGTILAAAGVVLSLVIVWIHAQIERGGAGYTSFCNVNQTINCDLVLASPFSRIHGVPVAQLALLAYGTLAGLYQAALRASPVRARTALLLSWAGSIGAAGFAAYMAFVSFYVLGTVCLMCAGLYVVSLGLLAVALLVPSRYASACARTGTVPLSSGALAGFSAVALLGVAGVAAASWPGLAVAPSKTITVDEIRAADPKFYSWYVALPVVSVAPSGGHTVGAANAPVTIIEFSDFECAYCKSNHAILKELLESRPDLVRVVYKHFPLDTACNEGLEASVHAGACRAAEAAECAGEQSRFVEMADALFENQSRLFENYLFTLAERSGLEMSKFNACMSERRGRDAVLADTRDGNRLSITSTPTLFINGRRVVGTLPDLTRYVYAAVIESQLAAGAAKKAAS